MTRVLLHLKSEQQAFEGLNDRGYPILTTQLECACNHRVPYSQEELLILAARMTRSLQPLGCGAAPAQEIKRLYALSDLEDYSFETITIDPDIVDLWTRNLTDPALMQLIAVNYLTLPNIKVFLDEIKAVDPQRLRRSHELLSVVLPCARSTG